MSDFFGKNKVLVMSMAAGAVGFGLYYWYNNVRVATFSDPYPREKVVATLKEFRREFNRLYAVVYQQVARVKQLLRSNGRPVHAGMNEELMAMLVDQNPDFADKVEEIEEEVYAKHDITDKVKFQKSCEITYRDDPEIRGLLRTMHQSLESVISGNAPENNVTVPAGLTSELVLDVVRNSAKDFQLELLDLAEKYLKQGKPVSKDNLEFLMDLKKISTDGIKMGHMRQRGIDKMGQDPESFFSKAVEKYIQSDPNDFRSKMYEIETQNKLIMQMIFAGGLNEDVLEKFREDIRNPKATEDRIDEVNPHEEQDNTGEIHTSAAANANEITAIKDSHSGTEPKSSVNQDVVVKTTPHDLPNDSQAFESTLGSQVITAGREAHNDGNIQDEHHATPAIDNGENHHN
jgi:hypothetical protein